MEYKYTLYNISLHYIMLKSKVTYGPNTGFIPKKPVGVEREEQKYKVIPVPKDPTRMKLLGKTCDKCSHK